MRSRDMMLDSVDAVNLSPKSLQKHVMPLVHEDVLFLDSR